MAVKRKKPDRRHYPLVFVIRRLCAQGNTSRLPAVGTRHPSGRFGCWIAVWKVVHTGSKQQWGGKGFTLVEKTLFR